MAKTGSGRVSGMIEVPAPDLPDNVEWVEPEVEITSIGDHEIAFKFKGDDMATPDNWTDLKEEEAYRRKMFIHQSKTDRLEALAKLLDSVKGNGVEQTKLRRTQDCPGMQETQLNIQKAIAEQLAKTEAI